MRMSTATADRPTETGQKRNIWENAVALNVKLESYGNSKKLPTSLITVDADIELIRAGKKLLESDQLKAITRLDGDLRTYLYAKSLPSMMRGGIYVVPLDLVEEVDGKLVSFRERREALVEELIAAYPLLIGVAEIGRAHV